MDPQNYADAPTEGIRKVLEKELGQVIPRGVALPTGNQSFLSLSFALCPESIGWIRMGTTVATNALLERNGERVGLLITKGFKDLLFIGNQSRPKIFDLNIQIPEVLYEDVVEVDERIRILDQTEELSHDPETIKMGTNGCQVVVEKQVNESELTRDLENMKRKGIKSVAILFLHSFMYVNPTYEFD